MMRHIDTYTCLLVLLGALVLTGCEESVDPVLGTDERFSLYGFLDPQSDRQEIRVFSIDDVLQPATTETLDGSMYSVRESTGERTSWRDSVVTYRDGSVGHVFLADVRPEFDEDYRLVVESSDGVTTEARIHIPPVARPELGQVQSAGRNVIIRVPWRGAPRLLEAQIVYNLQVPSFVDTTLVDRTARLNTARIEETTPGEWSVVFRPSQDIGILFQLLNLRPGVDPMYLVDIEVEAFVAGAEWNPPGGIFDPELLVEPGVFSNVQNGFGFVGGGYVDEFRFSPSDPIKEDAGFTVD